MSNVLICVLGSFACIVNGWERPDQRVFWYRLSIFCDAASMIMAVTA